MKRVCGKIVEVSRDDNDGLVGKIKVRGALKKIPLGLLTDAARGDRVLNCDGVAISKVIEPPEREKKYVPRDSRKTH